MIKRILLLLLLITSISYCQQVPDKEINPSTDNVNSNEYDINKIKIDYLPNHLFSNATFDLEMNFIPDINKEISFYKNFFVGNIISGNIKRITRFTKKSNSDIKEFKETTLYDYSGYKIETKYEDGLTRYFYDEKHNVIREISLSGSDTIQINEITYNSKNQIVSFTKKNSLKKKEQYNLFITIEYNEAGFPILLKNNHPIKEYSFIKKISYDGNIVTETEFSNDKKVDERIYWYSKDNKVLKYEHNKSYATFSEYNKKNELIKEMTYLDNEFAWINTYLYNDKGDIIRWVISNDPKVDEEVNNYEIQYDNLNNMIFEKRTENTSDKISEVYYEYEYSSKQ